MAGFNNASLLDVFNAGTNFGNTVMDQGNKWNKEAADIELNAMKNQFNSDVNDLFNKMQASNNYEDWNKDLNNFMEKTVASTGNKSAGNPYYCRNGYMAQAAKEMLEGQRVQLQAKVDQMVWAKETEHLTEAYQKNRDADRVNQLLTPQQKYDNGMKEARALFETGRISESAFNKEQDRLYQQTYSDAYMSQVSGLFDAAINNGWSFEKIIEETKKDPVTMKKLGLDGMEEAVDLTQLQASLNKTLKQDYQAKVKDLQDSNANKLAAIYRKVTAAETETEKLQAKREGQALLKTMEGGFKLDENRMTEYAYKFNIEPPKATKTGTGGSTSSSSSSGSTTDPKETYSNEFKWDYDWAINEAIENGMSEDQARVVVRSMVSDAIKAGKIKEINTQDQNEIDKYIEKRSSRELEHIGRTIIDTVFKDYPQFSGTKKILDKLTTDFAKDPESFGENTIGRIYNNIIDLAASGNMNKINEKELNDLVEGWRNASYAAQLENVSKGITRDENDFLDYKDTKQRNLYFAQNIAAGEKNDVVIGRKDGTELDWLTSNDEKAYKDFEKQATVDFAEAFGVKPGDVKVTLRKDQYGDEIPVPEFSVNGFTYYPKATYDNRGKPTGYVYVNKDTGNELRPHEVNTNYKTATKAARKEAADNLKKAKTDQLKLELERSDEIPNLMKKHRSAPPIVKKYNPEGSESWNMGDVANYEILTKTIENIDKDIANVNNMSDSPQKQTAISKINNVLKANGNIREVLKDWDNWSDADKVKFILERM